MRVMGKRGMVASPHYLATGAGLDILRRGGHAVDAAIAVNAVLAVVAPTMCGMGGDLFALVYSSGKRNLVGLNASGRAPTEASVERVRELAGDRMPIRGPLTVTVPGCVDGWGRLHERYGRMPLHELLADAIGYAEDGFPVTESLARSLEVQASIFHPNTPARETFLPGGRPVPEGELLCQPRLVHTLRLIAERGAEAFYRGPIGEELVRSLRALGGLMSPSDLAEHQADWVEPLSTCYRDVEVYELPPNSQGMVALLMLNLLRHLSEQDIQEGGAPYLHLLAEVARLAYADRDAYLTDPASMTVSPDALLSDAYAARRASAIGHHVGAPTQAGTPGDTAYMCTADSEGNLVSLIESNFMGIGSGVMAGETGIMLQNRGAWFSLDSHHANVIAPRKRTLHTLMPAMAFRAGRPWLVFGTMGGSTQAQIHVQLLTHLVDQGMHPDEAIDAPRIDAVVGMDRDGRPLLNMEDWFPSTVVDDLRQRGHSVRLLPRHTSALGRAHMIQVLEDGTYVGAADSRTQSLAMGY